ncbi:MAG: YabP/YqfC family sporulation protein [Oscillospiraceae bacterium]|nr:YabP/YqfC family sporulation protein [Oscillospiraceae bacterium]
MMRKIQQFRQRENVLSVLPIVELVGQGRLLIENHQGVLSYAPNMIKIKVSYGCIIVEGNELQLMEMSRVKLAICGRINCLQILGR